MLGRRFLTVTGGVVAGAAAVAAIWWWTGDGATASALGRGPSIAPPDYVYLDNARVVLYLGQIEGGVAASERLTEQLTQNRNATVAASGFQVGGSSGRSSAVERVVTPTATARFSRLLDRLDAEGFLRTVDAAAPGKALAQAFGGIEEGTFVRLRNCSLRIPPYVEYGQAVQPSARLSPDDAWTAFLATGVDTVLTFQTAQVEAGRSTVLTGTGTAQADEATKRGLAAAATQLARVVRRNPRVPASCGETANAPRGALDMLVPLRLGELSPERSLLAGPVTVVGKVVRAVRRDEDAYVDTASLALFAEPVATANVFAGEGEGGLAADVTVLAPGAVILPIAIYK
ncbi:MAG: hypothetical protein HOQ03_05570 [Thermoleophilia bacterium]|nr:hypothetical protein [Thermoleophilia bacterium]